MSVPILLLKALESLESNDFKTFKWHLSRDVLEGCKPIPPYRLENADRTDTVTKLTQCYLEKTAVIITVTILRKMNQDPVALTLEKAYKVPVEEQAASSTTRSSLAAAAAPSISSDDESSDLR